MKKWGQLVGFSIFVTALASPGLWRLSQWDAQSDMLGHFLIASKLIAEGQWYTYSSYYPAIYILTLGGNENLAQISSFLLLALLTGLKAGTALYFARKWMTHERLAQLVALSYSFAMPVVNPFKPEDVYLGQFSANVWHNSTTIMASVFVLPAFWFGLRLLERADVRSAVWFSIFLFGLVASKPNFALSLGPVLALAALWLWWRDRNQTGFRRALLLTASVVPALVALLTQYIIVFQQRAVLADVQVVIAPFTVWQSYTSNIPFSLVQSLAGPVVVIWALGFRGLIRDRFLSVALVVLLVSLGQYVLIAEVLPDGSYAIDGNWTWAVIPSIALVFFRIAAITITRLEVPGTTKQMQVPWMVAGLVVTIHVLSGLYYVSNVGVDGFRTFAL